MKITNYLLHHCQSWRTSRNHLSFYACQDQNHLWSIEACRFCLWPDREGSPLNQRRMFDPVVPLQTSVLSTLSNWFLSERKSPIKLLSAAIEWEISGCVPLCQLFSMFSCNKKEIHVNYLHIKWGVILRIHKSTIFPRWCIDNRKEKRKAINVLTNCRNRDIQLQVSLINVRSNQIWTVVI